MSNGKDNLANAAADQTLGLDWRAPRERYYQVLRVLSGSAPVTRRSGKMRIVTRRLACNERLREAVHHWARVAMRTDPRSKERDAALRQRGHSHGRALRTRANRQLGIARAMLKSRTLFDPNHKAARPAAA